MLLRNYFKVFITLFLVSMICLWMMGVSPETISRIVFSAYLLTLQTIASYFAVLAITRGKPEDRLWTTSIAFAILILIVKFWLPELGLTIL